ncbi:hypothetical protein QP179_01890 [Sphingomonas aurantiaca]|uniref:hypothetical protein n=1 Tax=Sphingomonas aurantiaca TaxID=185949 RepID=UPI002FE3730E
MIFTTRVEGEEHAEDQAQIGKLHTPYLSCSAAGLLPPPSWRAVSAFTKPHRIGPRSATNARPARSHRQSKPIGE